MQIRDQSFSDAGTKNKIESRNHEIMILIVDDNDIFRKTLRRYLRNKFKFSKVIEATNGIDAVRLVRESVPDLIVLDINLPQMSGLDVAHQVKQEFPFIPIVILSNFDEAEYRFAAKSALVDAYITKPNLVSELPSVIQALLANPF
jgi:DNA-binding NarL/FixJ family response regulator